MPQTQVFPSVTVQYNLIRSLPPSPFSLPPLSPHPLLRFPIPASVRYSIPRS